MFLYGIGLVGLFFYYYKKPVSSVSLYAIAAALALPAMCIGMGLAWFNYVRFGNPLDFGMAYQLSTWDYQQPKIVLRFLPYGLIDFLFMPPRPVLDFPYLYLHPMPHLFNPRTCLGGFAGVFPMFPIFGMALLFPFCPLDRPLQWFCRIVTVSVVLILLYLSCYFYLTYRYFMDFLPLMWMVATIVLFSCHGWLRAHRYYSYAVIAAVAYSLVMGLETAVIGECNGLHSIRMNQHAPKNAPDSEAITEEEEAAAAERDSYIRHKIVSRQIQFTH
jgi:hypothetical protein